MDFKLWTFILVTAICKHGQCQGVTLHQLSTVNVSGGEAFTLWCNVTGTLTTPDGYQVTWKKSTSNMTIDPWCYGIARPNGRLQNRECKRNDATFFNVSDEYATGLHIMSATTEDIGKYTCSFAVVFGAISQSNEETDVFVKEKLQTTMTPTETTLSPTETPECPSTITTSTTKITQTTIKGSSSEATESPNIRGLSREKIIAIGAGGGAGVLLITIIVAVVCVKKKGKGNSTSDIDERKPTYRKSTSFEQNAENTDDKRKSNPLEKNVENLHYADLTLHDNPKSPSYKGTGSAKSKTLTVNPSDDKVEYAAVMTS